MCVMGAGSAGGGEGINGPVGAFVGAGEQGPHGERGGAGEWRDTRADHGNEATGSPFGGVEGLSWGRRWGSGCRGGGDHTEPTPRWGF